MTDPREELKRLVDEFAANCCLYDKAAVAGADSTELDLRGAVRDNSESALHAAIDALFAQPVIRFKPLPEDIAEITARRLPSMLEVVQPAESAKTRGPTVTTAVAVRVTSGARSLGDAQADMVLVPREPTVAMLLAGARHLIDGPAGQSYADEAGRVWAVMIAAAKDGQ